MKLSPFVIITILLDWKFLVQAAKGPRPSFQEQMGYMRSNALEGDSAKPAEFPWAASLYCAIERTLFGGTLIHQQWVVTTASNLIRVEHVIVSLGGVKFINIFTEPGIIRMTSSEFVLHPDFFYSPPINNIAMIKLPKAVPISAFVKPIAALSMDDFSTEEGTAKVVGYGKLENGVYGMILRYSVVNLLPVEKCVSMCVKADVVNTTDTICSKMRSGAGPCIATHGSALIRKNVLLGLVSCFPNCDAKVPSLYTKIAPYADWINQTIYPSPPSYYEHASTTRTTKTAPIIAPIVPIPVEHASAAIGGHWVDNILFRLSHLF